MRKLTISALFQPRRRGSASAPHLRLTGHWLREAGFPVGARVRVQVQHGQLVITPEACA